MVMNSRENHLETISEIRKMMENSSRFISLSGLSGVAAGTYALAGAAMIYLYLGIRPFDHSQLYYIRAEGLKPWGMDYKTFFVLVAVGVITLTLITAIWLTTRKARSKGQKIWDKLTQRLLLNFFIPLVVGGLFCLSLLRMDLFGLIAPSTLIFYGLGLINASKYTYNDIRYLGISEVALGLIALNFIGYGLEFWALGFGILHIVYGMLMHFKYERGLTTG